MVSETLTYLVGRRDLCMHVYVLLWIHMHVYAHLHVVIKKKLLESCLTYLGQIKDYWYKELYHLFFSLS